MNDMAKNLMLWVVVAVVLMVVFQSFTRGRRTATQEVLYSQFIEDVRATGSSAVEIAEDERSVASSAATAARAPRSRRAATSG
jgi:cell division protease FtsH